MPTKKTRPRTRRERRAAIWAKITDERKKHRDNMWDLLMLIDKARLVGADELVADLYRRRSAECDRHKAAVAKLEKRAREV
jgi:hypothetical protein